MLSVQLWSEHCVVSSPWNSGARATSTTSEARTPDRTPSYHHRGVEGPSALGCRGTATADAAASRSLPMLLSEAKSILVKEPFDEIDDRWHLEKEKRWNR